MPALLFFNGIVWLHSRAFINWYNGGE